MSSSSKAPVFQYCTAERSQYSRCNKKKSDCDRRSSSLVSMQGKAAYKNKVQFPEDPEVLARTVLVGDMNPQITLQQVIGFSPSTEQVRTSFQMDLTTRTGRKRG